MMILAGDIGGTKSWLALVDTECDTDDGVRYEQRYLSSRFSTTAELLKKFLFDADTVAKKVCHATLALPGPVSDGHYQLTNLDWQGDVAALQQASGIGQITLINDFAASAEGVATLTESDTVALNQCDEQPYHTRVITGAGTGLGLAWIEWQQGGYRSFATEGGHIDFAPNTAIQQQLLASLREQFGHVSYERLLSGSGLEQIYRFCCQQHGNDPGNELTAAEVSERALAGDSAAMEAVDHFVDIYGAWVGNIALLYRPHGGLYIAGGMAAKMRHWLCSKRFINACYNKGRMSGEVARIPIKLVTNERLGLQGAIASAVGRLRSEDSDT